jgi:DNA replication and repair protein RecF
MKITNLKLTNFRNYSNLNLSFHNNINILIGNNGVGKTNIVEAIYYLSLTRSFRTNLDKVLIKEGEEYAVINATIFNKISNNYKITIFESNKNIKIDNTQITKIGDYISKINIVLFNAEDLKLIKDNPSIHRKLINMELSIVNNEYLKLLSLYNKILKQRNMYLKTMQTNGMASVDYLNIVTDKLIEIGLKIYEIRFNYIDTLNTFLTPIFNKIVKKDNLKVNYISNYKKKTAENLKKEYQKCLQRDINYGKTTIGIHLDDYTFELDKKIAKEFLSEGELKNAVISFKLAEISYSIKIKKVTPILILDDLFSELDDKKINKIIGYFNKNIQIFITTTDIDKVNKKLLKNCKVFKLTNKRIEEKIYE